MKDHTILFVMDPIESLNRKKDSTILMMQSALAKGAEVWFCQPHDLLFRRGELYALAAQIKTIELTAPIWYTHTEVKTKLITDFNAVMQRKDPPFDMHYVMTSYLLEHAERAGVKVVNSPKSVRDCNEKLFILDFPQCITDTVITTRADVIQDCLEQWSDLILKPLDGMGGAGIFRLTTQDPNISSIIETITQHGKSQIMVQRYLPEITQGDKRILLINGEPCQYGLARLPKSGETRANLAAGGRGVAFELSARDRWLCEQIGPTLKARRLYFVGLDVIGDYVTEINVTSPTCLREILDQTGDNIADKLITSLQ